MGKGSKNRTKNFKSFRENYDKIFCKIKTRDEKIFTEKKGKK